MGTWVLTIRGKELEDFVPQIAQELIDVVAKRGHTLLSAELGTDNGMQDLSVPPPTYPTDEVPVDTPPDVPVQPEPPVAVVPGDSPSESAPTA